MSRDGFSPSEIKTMQIADTEIIILPDFGTLYNIDSVLIVKHGNESVINLNDCNPTPEFMKVIKQMCPTRVLRSSAYHRLISLGGMKGSSDPGALNPLSKM